MHLSVATLRAVDLWVGSRELYRALRDYAGTQASRELLRPWLAAGRDTYRAQLDPLRSYGEIGRRPDRCGEYWLAIPYALSRISDVLLLGFQPELDSAIPTPWAHQLHLVDNTWPAVTISEYLELFTGLGMTEITESRFDPFCHEIVEVEQDHDPDAPITVIGQLWPGLMLGQMLFSRAGVRVRAGVNSAERGMADRSRLHATFLRRYRPTDDPSLGWGGNSQWDTDFRRDYRTDDAIHLNIDAETDPEDDDLSDGSELLTETERHDLLRHRCLLRLPGAARELADKDPHWQNELWPYGWSLTIPTGQPG